MVENLEHKLENLDTSEKVYPGFPLILTSVGAAMIGISGSYKYFKGDQRLCGESMSLTECRSSIKNYEFQVSLGLSSLLLLSGIAVYRAFNVGKNYRR